MPWIMKRRSRSAAAAIGWWPNCRRRARAAAIRRACSRWGTGEGCEFTAAPGAVPAAEPAWRVRRASDPVGGARRDRRRRAAQPDALRVPDPGVEGAAPVARGRGRAAGAARRARLRRRSGGRHRRAWRALLRIRAAGAEAGWAFQLQDPRTIMLLLLLAVAITANLLGLFELPVLGGGAQPGGQLRDRRARRLRRDALRRPVPRRRARHRAALPPAGSIAMFAALGLGLALPFVLLAFVPALATRLPKPGPWMDRLKRFLAIPMAASAVAALWLLTGWAGERALGCVGADRCWRRLLCAIGRRQQRGRAPAIARRAAGADRRVVAARSSQCRARDRTAPQSAAPSRGAKPASPSYAQQGKPGLRLFHRRLVPDAARSTKTARSTAPKCATRSSRRA